MMLVASNVQAGGSSSGGAPPALANFETETDLLTATEVHAASELAFKNAITSALNDEDIEIKVGESKIKVRPSSFDFNEKTLSVTNPVTGAEIKVRKALPLKLITAPTRESITKDIESP